jgi:hypothetical protein
MDAADASVYPDLICEGTFHPENGLEYGRALPARADAPRDRSRGQLDRYAEPGEHAV